jgi:hypothetical protein
MAPPPSEQVLSYWLAGADLFVCADGAGHPYEQLPRLPDVVIGDFDSLSGRVLAGRGGPLFLQVDDPYTTDSEKALLYVCDEGCEEAVLLGATGWRLDHTLFNVQLMERFGDRLRMCLSGHGADGVRVGAGRPGVVGPARGHAFLAAAAGRRGRRRHHRRRQLPAAGRHARPGRPHGHQQRGDDVAAAAVGRPRLAAGPDRA